MELTRTIELPERLDAGSIAGLRAALDENDARVWVLRGSADAFCRGMDLAAAASSGDVGSGARAYAALLQALLRAPRPTIAVVEGETLGGGVGIAAACDRVIATSDATFALPESLFGLMPAMVVPVLLERMSAHAVRLLALSGASRAAEWALGQGLVDDLGDARDVPLLLRTRARELSRAHPAAVRALRAWVPRARTLPVADAIDDGAALLTDLLSDPGTQRALRAFVEEGAVPWSP